jgi:hypothetical protein
MVEGAAYLMLATNGSISTRLVSDWRDDQARRYWHHEIPHLVCGISW